MKKKQDIGTKLTFVGTIVMLGVVLVMLWSTYYTLVKGGTETSAAVRIGLNGLTLAIFVFVAIVVLIAHRVDHEIETKQL